MRTKSYVVMGPPIAWKRARINSHNRNFYDAQAAEKVNIGIELSDQHGKEPLFDKPISFDVIFYMKRPERFVGKTKPVYHSCAPDVDNCIKFLLDTTKDILLVDDRLVCYLSAKKIYAEYPRTEFTITEIE